MITIGKVLDFTHQGNELVVITETGIFAREPYGTFRQLEMEATVAKAKPIKNPMGKPSDKGRGGRGC
jgi:hypothetical protein